MTEPSSGFFEISAQIIPLIFVALAIELKVFNRVSYYDDDKRQINPFVSLSSLVAMGLLMVGEWFALDALWDDQQRQVNAEVVRGALYFGAVGVLAPFVQAQMAALRQSIPPDRRAKIQWWAWTGLFLAVVGLALTQLIW